MDKTMVIYIEYELETASGQKARHYIHVYSLKQAEETCKTIEKVGYKITMVCREE